MIIIQHRCNSIYELKKTPNKYGIEIDIRTFGKKIILDHDPWNSTGVDFNKWIKQYFHKILILNVKEDGLEKEILKIMKKNHIKNFFFLDQSFFSLIKTLKTNEERCALRISDYESFETAFNIKKKPRWVWLDCFEKTPLDIQKIRKLKKFHYKICIASPELHDLKRATEIEETIKKIKKINFYFDAVCTKVPLVWEKLLVNL